VVDEELCAEPGTLRDGALRNCTPTANETRYRFERERYREASTRAVTAPWGLGVPLAEAGLDDGSGRGWAGRCYRRLQDGKLDDAELDCKRALARGTDTEIRASTLENLALIAEKRSDLPATCGYLEKSLAIRPNNGTTKAKRDELCRGPP
jgi:hypothetical protein